MKRILVFLLVLFIILDVQGQREKGRVGAEWWGCRKAWHILGVEGVGRKPGFRLIILQGRVWGLSWGVVRDRVRCAHDG